MNNLKSNRILSVMTAFISVLILFSCIEGVFNKSLYSDLINLGRLSETLRIGSVSQDMIFIPLAAILLILSIINLIKPNLKILILILGITGNMFYGYGLYVIQAQYTSIYMIYLLIFGLSVYTLIFGLSKLLSDRSSKLNIPKSSRISIAVFFLCIAFMLGVAWIMRVSGDVLKHIPGETYGVFVLDLGIVFPAIAITAFCLLFNKNIGNILAGVLLVKVFTICLSWGFGEWYLRIAENYQGTYDMLIVPSVLTVISIIFIILYMKKLSIEKSMLNVEKAGEKPAC